MYQSVPTIAALQALKNFEDEEVVYVEANEMLYICQNGNWIPYEPNDNVAEQPQLTLYDLNKMLISQMPNETDDKKIKKIFKNYFRKTNYDVYMLLCAELRHFTVLLRDKKSPEFFEDVMLEILKNLGNIKSVEYQDDEVIEIWFQDYSHNEIHVAYLFNYEEGVIKCQ